MAIGKILRRRSDGGAAGGRKLKADEKKKETAGKWRKKEEKKRRKEKGWDGLIFICFVGLFLIFGWARRSDPCFILVGFGL
mgnify:CR=1 FL=1